MNTNKYVKKAQSLPLNTIVIAILVIIVLLVIIVFFTSNLGKTGNQIDSQNTGACSVNNPVISTLGFKETQIITEGQTCEGDWKRVVGVANCCAK